MDIGKNNSNIELVEYYNINENELYENKYGIPTSAYAVIAVKGRFLLGFNKYRNQWEFPAGKIELGESAIAAARRELFEETHQRIDELKFCGLFKIYDSSTNKYRFRAVYYGKADKLEEFIPNQTDEMSNICLWDFYDKNIYVDQVDCKMVEMSVLPVLRNEPIILQVLVAAVGQEPRQLAEQMKLETAAVIVNQCDRWDYEEYQHQGHLVKAFSCQEKGVGLSRNHALLRAEGELCLFSDEDIVLESGYGDRIIAEFNQHPEADLLLFNVTVDPRRATYHNTGYKRIRWYNYGRYPTYSVAARVEKLRYANVSFSLLFGGGARYSNGEDSLFLHDCLKKGLRLYASSVVIGAETYRESTWFRGYQAKFFRDRGVLYHYLYGSMAKLFSLRFLWAHRREMCQEMKLGSALRLMKEGIGEGKRKGRV